MAASLYNTYANGRTAPSTRLNAFASVEHWQAVERKGRNRTLQPNRSHAAHVRGRSLQAAAGLASAVAHAFKPIELVVGTGRSSRGPADVCTRAGLLRHLQHCLEAPTDTGLVGLSLGVAMASVAAQGALVGAVIGLSTVAINQLLFNPLQLFYGGEHFVRKLSTLGAACALTALAVPLAVVFAAAYAVRLVAATVKVGLTAVALAAGCGLGALVGAGERAAVVAARALAASPRRLGFNGQPSETDR